MAKTEAELLAALTGLGIPLTLSCHPPFFTVEQSLPFRPKGETGHGKCLFLVDPKGTAVLAAVLEEKRVDLKKLSRQLGLGRFSFGSAERLRSLLGVVPGAVTPFAVINLPEDAAARGGSFALALDRGLLSFPAVFFHPLHNEATVGVSPEGLLTFLRAFGPEPVLVDV
jgi:Ala-tRNA(Pro) deacylase